MGNLTFAETKIKGLWVIEQKVFGDDRGFFMETYNEKEFKEAGLDLSFVQDNYSTSKKGVLRGLHFQKCYPQGKLVRVTKGEVFDVAVDLRKYSSTYMQWFGIILNEENKKQLYVPEGFAHGFLVLSEKAEFMYKCTDFYHPEGESGYMWNDPMFNIKWPEVSESEIVLSKKDLNYSLFKKNSFSYNLS